MEKAQNEENRICSVLFEALVFGMESSKSKETVDSIWNKAITN